MKAGSPVNAIYAELGPGRGTLCADALRVLRRAGFTGEVHLVETSPVLRQAQAAAVPDANWNDSIDTLPDRPLLLIANEFFDALPVRQLVDGIERKIVIAAGGLAFDRDGEIVEESPARSAAARQIAERLAAHGGVAIIVDYGHAQTKCGDTLQAVKGHRFAPVLADPGEQDLTAHVDFEALAAATEIEGVKATTVVTQGDWLRRLGIEQRAAVLAQGHHDRREEVDQALRRLTDGDAMGALFKVMALHSARWPEPAGFPRD